MKKALTVILSLFAVLICAFLFLTGNSFAAGHEIFVSQDGQWYCAKLEDGTVSVCACMFSDAAYLGESKYVTVPETIDSYAVSGVGEYAFCQLENIRTVFLPDSITFIEKNAFYGCPNLAQVTIPSSVKSMGIGVFDGGTNAVVNVEKGSFAHSYCIENNVEKLCVSEPETKASGFKNIAGKTYCFDKNGIMQFGWRNIGSYRYYFNRFGITSKGWTKIGGQWYCFTSGGKMKNGWIKKDGKIYYLTDEGPIAKGWKTIDSRKFHFNDYGVLSTGWRNITNSKGNTYRFYFGSNGIMRTGWKDITNSKGRTYRFYFGDNGIMRTGFKDITNSKGNTYRFYFGDNGVMRTGWQKIKRGNGIIYLHFFRDNGTMHTGWLKYNKKLYYINSKGIMVTGKQVISSKTYYFDSKGRWIKLDSESSRIVYITKYGKKYHYGKDCIKGNYDRTYLSDAVKNGLEPCEKCVYG